MGRLLLALALLLLGLPLWAVLRRGLAHLGALGRDLDVFWLSLALAGSGTLLVLLLGLLLAFWGLEGGVGRWGEALLLLPYLIPPFVVGMGLLFSLQGLGLKATGVFGILLAWTLHYTPLAYALLRPQVGAAFGLLQAARVHGVRGVRALKAFLPPLLPALLAGGGALYLALLGNFGIPAVLGLPERVYLLPTLVYARLLSPLARDPLGEAAALALLLGLAALPALLLHRPPALEATLPPPSPGRRGARLAFLAYAFLALLLSLLGLFREALVNPYTGRLEAAFGRVLELPVVRAGLLHSFLLALSAALLLLGLAALLRPWPRALRAVRGVMDLYYLLPGSLLGVGLILLLGGSPLYGTPWLLLLAYLLNFAALALRALEGGPRVEGSLLAARVHGLPAWRAWLRVGFPLLAPTLFGGFFLIFPLAFAEITLSALLYAPGSETVGVAALSLLNGGLYREAAALGLLLTGASALALMARRVW
jgi:iron(III) transport system permease protein